ncbi:MAG: hypothetical protein K2I74_11170 [Treponemataceae bacterium]|nr:hypothetical protein [Treponemataceae bacterium]
MRRKTILVLGMVVLIFALIGCASTNVVAATGYKLKPDTKSERLGIAPVLCNNEWAVCFLDWITSDQSAQDPALLEPRLAFVLSEKGSDGTKYFISTGEYWGRPDGTLSFSFPENAERSDIPEDKIFPMEVAQQYAKTVLLLFGGTTGSGNISSKNQIKREELALGGQLRQASLSYWKEKFPIIHKIILGRLPYWRGFSPTIQVWLARVVAEGNIQGYEELLAVAEKTKSEPKKTVDPVTTYRGDEAVDYIVIGAERLLKQGRITETAFERIVYYTQLNNGQSVYGYMSRQKLTAEEFCLGVSRGEIYLQF